MRRWLLVVAVGLGCGPAVETPAEGGGSTSASPPEGTTGGVADPDPTTGANPTGHGSTSAAPVGSSSTTAAESSTGGCIDEGPTVAPDPNDPETRCLWDGLDCGCGYRCNTYTVDENDYTQWFNNGCFPLDPDHVELGDACEFREYPWSGLDNCPAGAQCQDWDRDGFGTCKEFCDGDPDYECSQPGAIPYVACQDCGCICEISCDPRLDECEEGDGCYLGSLIGQCAPDASGDLGAFGDPCEFINACDPGLACIGAKAVPNCESGSGCCAPYCDIDDPVCPEGTQCQLIWEPGEEATPVLEGLGYCATPGAFE